MKQLAYGPGFRTYTFIYATLFHQRLPKMGSIKLDLEILLFDANVQCSENCLVLFFLLPSSLKFIQAGQGSKKQNIIQNLKRTIQYNVNIPSDRSKTGLS